MRLNIIELGHSGHQRQHLLNVIEGWRKYASEGSHAEIVVSDSFLQSHPDVVRSNAEFDRHGIWIHPIAEQTSQTINREQIPLSWIYPPGPPHPSPERARWELVQRRVRESRSNALLLMHLDQFLIPIAAQCESAGDIYGILHAPPPRRHETAPGHKLWALHQRAILTRAMSHPRLRAVFTFDDFLASEGSRLPHADKLVVLPDPVEIPLGKAVNRDIARRRLGIPAGRTNFFFFGRLARRKGFFELVNALSSLSPDDRSKVSISFAGPLGDIPILKLNEKIDELRRAGIHVFERFEFISDNEACELFDASDVVVVPYLDHLGISGVMLRAAAHKRPVLSQPHGLMGEMVRKHRLGMTTNPRITSVFAGDIKSILDGRIARHFDPAKALSLARHHNANDYQRLLFERVLDSAN